jgi:hypothetical protein
MRHLQLSHDHRRVARDEETLEVIDDHFIHPVWPQRRARNLGQLLTRLDVSNHRLIQSTEVFVSLLFVRRVIGRSPSPSSVIRSEPRASLSRGQTRRSDPPASASASSILSAPFRTTDRSPTARARANTSAHTASANAHRANASPRVPRHQSSSSSSASRAAARAGRLHPSRASPSRHVSHLEHGL